MRHLNSGCKLNKVDGSELGNKFASFKMIPVKGELDRSTEGFINYKDAKPQVLCMAEASDNGFD